MFTVNPAQSGEGGHGSCCGPGEMVIKMARAEERQPLCFLENISSTCLLSYPQDPCSTKWSRAYFPLPDSQEMELCFWPRYWCTEPFIIHTGRTARFALWEQGMSLRWSRGHHIHTYGNIFELPFLFVWSPCKVVLGPLEGAIQVKSIIIIIIWMSL